MAENAATVNKTAMEKPQHTPGPWEASTGENDGRDFITIEHDGFPLCEVRGTNDMSCIDEEQEPYIADEMVANAKLIAAAPDLLEACIEFVRKVEAGEARSIRSYAQMKAAIKKATT